MVIETVNRGECLFISGGPEEWIYVVGPDIDLLVLKEFLKVETQISEIQQMRLTRHEPT